MKSLLLASAHRRPSLLVSLGAATLIGACGGGGGSGAEDNGVSECRAYAARTGITYDDALQFGLCQAFFDGSAITSDVEPERDTDETAEPPATALPPISSFPRAVTPDTSSGDLLGSNFYAGATNGALLRDLALGLGTAPNDTVARSVPFIAENTDTSLIVRDARVIGPRGDSTSASIVIVVENVGNRRLCNVLVSSITPLAEDGRQLGMSFGLALADGSAALSRFGRHLKHCIEPSSAAYVVEDVFSVEDEIAVVHIGSVGQLLNFSAEAVHDGTPVVTEHYSNRNTLGVDIVNTGSVGVELDDVVLFLLDENGQVVHVDELYVRDDELAPGEMTSARRSLSEFEGTATSARVIVDFDPIED